MKNIIISALIMAFTYQQKAYSSQIDLYISQMKTNKINNPFEKGEFNASTHPHYKKLVNLSKSYGSSIEWSHSVSARVLELPFNQERMKIKAQDEFDGWFDEYTKPNLIIIHQEASLVTLVHELRHALHLGNHKIVDGHWLDLLLQNNRKHILNFQSRISLAPIEKSEGIKLKKLSTRLLETCSEIVAHRGDLEFAVLFEPDLEDAHRTFIKEYLKEFNNAYKQLKMNPNSSNESFIEDLKINLAKYLKT